METQKNGSHINIDIYIPCCLPRQRFKLDVKSPKMSMRDKELLFFLVGRLLYTKKLLYQTYKHIFRTYSQGWDYQ